MKPCFLDFRSFLRLLSRVSDPPLLSASKALRLADKEAKEDEDVVVMDPLLMCSSVLTSRVPSGCTTSLIVLLRTLPSGRVSVTVRVEVVGLRLAWEVGEEEGEEKEKEVEEVEMKEGEEEGEEMGEEGKELSRASPKNESNSEFEKGSSRRLSLPLSSGKPKSMLSNNPPESPKLPKLPIISSSNLMNSSKIEKASLEEKG